MKRYLWILFLLLFGLTACATTGNNQTPDVEVEVGKQGENDEKPGNIEVVVGDPEPTMAPTNTPLPTSKPTATHTPTPTNAPTATNTPTPTPIPFVEVVIADNERYTIKITDCTYDRYGDCELKVYIENKSEDIQYRFGLENISVDGLQCHAYFGEYVNAGRKANKTISISDSMLKGVGITDFTDIELLFEVYDANDWTADNYYEIGHVYPKGEENVKTYVRATNESDVVLMDNEYTTIILTGYKESNIFGDTMDLFIINKAEESLTFTAEDASINGVMSSPYWSTTLAAGKCTYSSMSWWDATLYQYGIKEFDVFEYTLRVYNHEWIEGDIANEIIRVYPNGTENVKLYEREKTETDIVLVDDENMSIVITGFEEDKEDGDFYAHVYLRNKTDKVLSFSDKDVSVNGYMVDPYFYKEVAAEKSAFTKIQWDEDDLKANGIEKVYDIEMILYVDNADNWRDIYLEEKMYIEVEKDESEKQSEDPNAMVLVENDECLIKLTKIDPLDKDGYTLSILFENKSEHKTYTLSLDNIAVNGVQIAEYMSCEALSGKKVKDEIEISDNLLKEIGITEFTNIELMLKVYDSNDWSADYIVYEAIHIYPEGKENAQKYVHKASETDNVIVNNEYISVIVTSMEYEEDGDYVVGFYLENKTENSVYFTSDEDAVNGYVINGTFYKNLLPYLCTYTEMVFESDDLKENGINTVDEIEMFLKVKDNNDWLAEPYYNGLIKLVP